MAPGGGVGPSNLKLGLRLSGQSHPVLQRWQYKGLRIPKYSAPRMLRALLKSQTLILVPSQGLLWASWHPSAQFAPHCCLHQGRMLPSQGAAFCPLHRYKWF
ncbi:RING finger protein 38 [Platysternon megacephalum]|uniref:RING finger protein 38 n=1 Tax=Platysternon megacephalum TaxID=55544 RepID=A0A4D9DLG9_9SAUR|nr:RING finger protein 38 [Platysternon megacephalum]